MKKAKRGIAHRFTMTTRSIKDFLHSVAFTIAVIILGAPILLVFAAEYVGIREIRRREESSGT